jgi:hypothetical protein
MRLAVQTADGRLLLTRTFMGATTAISLKGFTGPLVISVEGKGFKGSTKLFRRF